MEGIEGIEGMEETICGYSKGMMGVGWGRELSLGGEGGAHESEAQLRREGICSEGRAGRVAGVERVFGGGRERRPLRLEPGPQRPQEVLHRRLAAARHQHLHQSPPQPPEACPSRRARA